MGIEEYRFLTRTMEQIADCSSRLESKKKKLPQTKRKNGDRENTVKDVKLKKENIERRLEELENRIEDLEIETSKLPTLKTLSANLLEAEHKIDPEGIRKTNPATPSETAPEALYGLVTIIWIFSLVFIGFASDSEFWIGVFSVFPNVESVCLFFILAPIIISSLLLKIENNSIQDRWEKKDSIVKQINKETRSIRNEISTIELMAVNVSRLDDLKREHRNINQKLVDLENNLAKGKREFYDLSNQISSLEEEIPALWDSIGQLIPFSTALEKA